MTLPHQHQRCPLRAAFQCLCSEPLSPEACIHLEAKYEVRCTCFSGTSSVPCRRAPYSFPRVANIWLTDTATNAGWRSPNNGSE